MNKFTEVIAKANRAMAGWPEWKKQATAQALENSPAVKTPRQPFPDSRAPEPSRPRLPRSAPYYPGMTDETVRWFEDRFRERPVWWRGDLWDRGVRYHGVQEAGYLNTIDWLVGTGRVQGFDDRILAATQDWPFPRTEAVATRLELDMWQRIASEYRCVLRDLLASFARLEGAGLARSEELADARLDHIEQRVMGLTASGSMEQAPQGREE